MMRSGLPLAWVLLALFSLSCAEGFGSGDNVVQGLLPTAGQSGSGSGSGGTGATGGTSPGDGDGDGDGYTGMPCVRGDIAPCDCPTGDEGMQVCMFDASSPTMGTFGQCTGCEAASGGAGGSGAGGTGGSASGCSGGSACTNSCFPVGVLACCTEAGRCGCTWAPGAYCF